MKKDREVWVLGSKSPYADRCIQWNDLSYPNFHEPDVLVIDLTSLDEGILQRIDKTKFEVARKQVFAKFINGGTVIYIITQHRKPSGEHMTGANQTAAGREGTRKAYTYSNYDISPIEFQIQTTEGTQIKLYNDEFSPYFKFVKKFSYYLNNFEMSSSLKDLEQDDDIVSIIAKFLRSVGKEILWN